MLGGYVVLSVAFFGAPVLGAPQHVALGSGKYPDDPSLFMWMLAWWPHALQHGLNPLVTHALFSPDGYNLTWTTSIPGPSVLVAPVTLAAGPVAAYNTLALLAPALNAFAAFLLCRYVTGRTWPAVAGGYVFGFSSYVLGALEGGHLHLSLVALLPLCVLLVLRHLHGELGSRRFVIALTAALVGEFLISAEVLLTMTLFGALALGLGLVALDGRPQIVRTGRLIGLAYGCTALVLSPLLYYMLFKAGTRPHVSARVYSADLANFVVPTMLTRAGRGQFLSLAHGFRGNLSEQGAYLGLPLIAIVALFAAQRRKRPGDWVPVLCAAGAAVLALGPVLYVGGSSTGLTMPWQPLTHLPLAESALPVRLVVYAFLASAVIVSLWLARRPSPGRWLLVALAIVALVPNTGLRKYHERYASPAFITHGDYARWLGKSDRVLVLPFAGAHAMRWQAQTAMRFALVGGYAQRLPNAYLRWPAVDALANNKPDRLSEKQFERFLVAKRVTAVLIDTRRAGLWPALLERMGLAPVRVGGVLLVRLDHRTRAAVYHRLEVKDGQRK